MTMADFVPDDEPEGLAETAMGWIVRLNSGTASEADRRAWRAWRATSPEHERAADEAEALWSNLSDLHFDRASGLVRPGRKPNSMSRRAVLKGIGGVAVAGSVGAAAWNSAFLRRLFADHATTTASTSRIDLPDGSEVTLNARSAINLAFGSRSRGISLVEGQAFCHVAADRDQPFEVAAGNVSLTTYGATFDIVRDLPHAGTEIAVVADTARILTASGESIDVQGGEIIAVDGSGRAGPVRSQNVADVGLWRQGLYRADARTLDEVVAALAPWYGGSIVVAGSGLHDLRVNAVLDLRDPRGSLDALQGGLPIRVRHLAGLISVISSA